MGEHQDPVEKQLSGIAEGFEAQELRKLGFWQRVIPFFRGKPDIASPEDIRGYLDQRAAYLLQKHIYEYTRSRAGALWQQLLSETDFKEALENSKWQSLPITLDYVGEVMMIYLRKKTRADAQDIAGLLGHSIRSIMVSYEGRTTVPEKEWAQAALTSSQRLRTAAIIPSRSLSDIPHSQFAEFFEKLPKHKKLYPHDELIFLGDFRNNLQAIHDEFKWRSYAKAIEHHAKVLRNHSPDPDEG
ncbi:hypothetical protein E1162_16390 [Rhodobacteraceae bacterium RKSG542]|uniref:hypothetical protein n=1 Tax=Pseudovibrio flavus TaxID=2529854 RepID=UPI0012BBDE3B|nr:hypothetical protein [Pseudovibrio flavus]MTI18827.1 hypothetical protein [Pseudovibrio flavus]